jgi:beta-aspartyl-peptidase (threonine type)
MSVALAAHGGAWNIPDDLVEPSRRGLEGPLEAGFRALSRGASALDVVEMVVRGLEDDPSFNAGTGSHLNREGRLELDASIMEGTRLAAGAVGAVSGLKHPVSVARRVLRAVPARLPRRRGREAVRARGGS